MHICISIYTSIYYMYTYLYIYMQVKGTTVFASRQWQVIPSKRSYDQVMGLLQSTRFECHPSFFCFFVFKDMRGNSTLTIGGGIKQPRYKQNPNKVLRHVSVLEFWIQYWQRPKHTQPETLTLTITPTQGLTGAMSTFPLFLLEMVRQGGRHALTLFLCWITFIV